LNHIDEGLKDFLRSWFSGFMKGLDKLDLTARNTILNECGSACAHTWAVEVFKEIGKKTKDLNSFLVKLNQELPDITFEKSGESTIEVTFLAPECGCDFVVLGLTRSPKLCHCSAFFIKTCFEEVLGKKVLVDLKKSLLRGDPECVLEVTMMSGNSHGSDKR
jgi:predicted hydrocarbon binding protein